MRVPLDSLLCTQRLRLILIAFLFVLLPLSPAFAVEKSDLQLVFQEDFESGMDGWSFTDGENWRIDTEDDGNHVLSLFTRSANERPYHAPRSVAFVDGLTAGSFILEARLKHLGEPYGHQDLCIIYNVEDEYKFYYTHLAPAPDPGAHTIFLVNDDVRESIATNRSDGVTWGDTFHDVRIVRHVDAGSIEVFFDDMTTPVMIAADKTLTNGRIGIGSYNDVGSFDDVKIWADPADAGYVSIFDGETLEGWNAPDMSYWSVEDGAITAQSTEENPCTKNEFLVWQGGDVANFELTCKFRLENNSGNSGIQFRSRIDENGMGVGYQADILPGGPWCGALADEYTGREPLMVANGHKTVVEADGTRTTEQVREPVTLRPAGEWNDYHILADGHRMVLTVNGKVSAEFIDYDEEEFDAAGILALQLREGPPMKVQFKDIYLKQLEQ